MRTVIICLAVIGAAVSTAFAGPNASGTLVVHDTGLAYTSDNSSYPSPAPACVELDTNAAMETSTVWKVYAAFPDPCASPRLKALSWGTSSTPNVVILGSGLPGPDDFEITQGNWPTNGSIGQSFSTTQTEHMVECYWFGGYAYGEAQTFATVPHAVQSSVFVDDSTPGNEDAITAFSWLGFGQAGSVACADCPPQGACCFADGTCQLLMVDACMAAGGTFYGGDCVPGLCPPPEATGACCIGTVCEVITAAQCASLNGYYIGDGVPCDPAPCVIPAGTTSWGRVKERYR